MAKTQRMLSAAVLGAVLAVGAAARSLPSQRAAVPVMVGGQAEIDACPSIGKVLQPAGAPLVVVRAGPSPHARPVARLAAGHLLWICSDNTASHMAGVVFGAAAQSPNATGIPADCGVQTPIAKARAYHGRGQSGWIDSAAFEAIAG